jgi:hypothetical protein
MNTYVENVTSSGALIQVLTDFDYEPLLLGGTKYIESVRGGPGFRAGDFRANPVEIVSHSSEVRTDLPPVEVSFTKRLSGRTYYYNGRLSGTYGVYRQIPITWEVTSPFGTVDEESLINQSLISAYANMKGVEYDLGVDLAEMRETLEMLRSPFAALRRSLKQWTKKADRFKGSGDAVTSTWLEYRYGIMPVVYSIQDIIALLEKESEQSNALRRSRGKANLSGLETTTWLSPYTSTTWKMTQGTTYKMDVEVNSHVYFKVTRAPSIARQLGVDWGNVPNIAWELTRLSFVLDWWLHIGDYLTSIRYDPNIVELGNCTSIVTALSRKDIVKDISWYGQIIDADHFNVTQTLRKLVRVVGTPKPLYPVVDWGFHSVKHTLDALALSWQSMPKIIKSKKR